MCWQTGGARLLSEDQIELKYVQFDTKLFTQAAR